MFSYLRSDILRYTPRSNLIMILRHFFSFASQDLQTTNTTLSSLLPCHAIEGFIPICNHLFRFQFSLLRSSLVWLWLLFYARLSHNWSSGECMAAPVVSSPLQTTLGSLMLASSGGASVVTDLPWRQQDRCEEKVLIRLKWQLVRFCSLLILLLTPVPISKTYIDRRLGTPSENPYPSDVKDQWDTQKTMRPTLNLYARLLPLFGQSGSELVNGIVVL